MSHDLVDDSYYVSHGGKIPVKWTAPEVGNILLATVLSIIELFLSIGFAFEEVFNSQ